MKMVLDLTGRGGPNRGVTVCVACLLGKSKLCNDCAKISGNVVFKSSATGLSDVFLV